MEARLMSPAQIRAAETVARLRAERAERQARRQRMVWTTLIVVSTAITYALTFAHYGLGI